MRYLAAGSLISAGLVAVLLISSNSSVLTQHAPATEIASPAQGVGFVGTFVQTQPNGSRWAGEYYRRHDYSFAMYGTHASPGRTSTRMVTIANAETMYQYLFREAVGHWVRVPLSSGPSAEGLRYRIKTGDTNGLVPEPEPFGGFTVYREQQADGSLRLLAPDLNFFPVLIQLGSGMRQEVTAIILAQPEAHLFLPPANAKVVDGPAPAVHHPR